MEILYAYVIKNFTSHTPFSHFSPPVSRATTMDGVHQGVQFYQNLVAHGGIEEDHVVGQEAASDLEGEEYIDMDYEFDETDDDKEDDKDTDEVLNEPPTIEVHQDHPILPRDSAGGTRSSEEEIAAL